MAPVFVDCLNPEPRYLRWYPTGLAFFSTVRGISRPQFYNPFSTVFLHPPAAK
jgi:hypothetical protein